MEKDATLNWLKEMRKGYIRLIVLTLLSKKPYHGYEIMKEVKEKTKGLLRFTSGGVYRILQDLEDLKYVHGEWETQKRRKRKIYRITTSGIIILDKALTKESQLASSMHNLFKEYLTGVLNVSIQPNETLRTPKLFAMLLESRIGKPEDSIEVLKEKDLEINQMIKTLQKMRRAIKRKVALKESNKLQKAQG